MFINSYNEIVKFPSRVQFYCQGCGNLTEKEFRRSTKPKLLCAVCNINDGKAKRTKEQKETSNKKRIDTINKKYGSYDNYLEHRDKAYKKTCIEKFGVDNPFKNEEIQEKSKDTKFKRYGDEHYTNPSKRYTTMIELYGAPTTLQSEALLSKVIETKKELYGEHFEGIVNKIKSTKKERYGDETYNNPEKNKETCLERYGVEHPMIYEPIKRKAINNQKESFNETYQTHYWNTDDFRIKSKQTMLELYGVENPAQSDIIRRRSYNRLTYDNMQFDSKWELAIWIYANDKGIPIEREPVRFEYEYDGSLHYYFPDFRLNGELVEIKGDHFFNPDGTMCNPYDHSMDGLFEAKHQCGLKNGVKFINNNDMRVYLDYIDSTYTKDYLDLFRNNSPFPYLNPDLRDTSDLGLIQHFHKSIYSAARKGKLSPFDAWKDKNLVKKSALNRLMYMHRCRPSDILQGFNVAKIAPKVSVFKPSLAIELINKYLFDADTIIDPFSGFSGRLLGAIRCNKEYKGWDINTTHVTESNEIIEYLSLNKNCTVSVQDLITSNVVDWSASNTCLFTCPPYGGKEHWNENNDEIEKSCDEWIDLCLIKHVGCKKYLFVVDGTNKYKEHIVETLENKSHFGRNEEHVVLIENK